MWVRRPPADYRMRTSWSEGLEFVWKDDRLPIYIMDNHRAALWCWMQHVARGDAYSFLHLDFHWDAFGDSDATVLDTPRFDELRRSLDSFDQLRAEPHRWPRFRWDNYIDPFFEVFPGVDEAHFAACQDEGAGWNGRHLLRAESLGLLRRLQPLPFVEALPRMLRDAPSKTVINIDLDVFGANGGLDADEDGDDGGDEGSADEDDELPPLDEDLIPVIFESVSDHMDRAHVVTVALSTECSGGWAAVTARCMAACQAMGIDCPFANADGDLRGS